MAAVLEPDLEGLNQNPLTERHPPAMKPIKVIAMSVAVPTVLGLGLGLAACGSSGGSSPGATKVKGIGASAEASLKNNKQLQSDLTDAYTALSACAKSQTGMIVTIPIPGSGEKPSVSNVSVTVIHHPVKAFKKIVACTPEGQKGGHATLHTVEVIVFKNGVGHGVLSTDFTDVAYFLATGKQLAKK
jgi:hypothetical protein